MKKGLIIFLGIILIIFVALHFLLEPVALHYANKALDNMEEYDGNIENVSIQLYRGAYRIDSVTIQRLGDEDTISPFFKVNAIDISVAWRALFKGKVVADIAMHQPVLNFKATKIEPSEEETDFVQVLEDMIPLRIETFEILNGEVHYLDKANEPVVDVYLKNINAMAENLSNDKRDEDPLPSKVSLSGSTIGGGTLSMNMEMFVMQEIPDFDLTLELSKVNLVALNDFSEAYANFNFEKGTFYTSTEIVMQDGDFKGYVKPIIEDFEIIDLSDDDSFVDKAWEVLVGSVMWIFKNKSEDRFATRVPFEGTTKDSDVNVLKTVTNVLRNAFIEAFQKNVEGSIDFQDAQNVDLEEEDKGFFEKVFSGSDDKE